MDPNTHYYVAASGAVPALVAIFIVDWLDRKRPEPWRLRWLVTLAGAVSTVPAMFIELVLTKQLNDHGYVQITYPGSAAQGFLVAGMVEEGCKIIFVYWLVWHRPEFDERMDGIVYAARAGLGFAAAENILYMSQAQDMPGAIHLWILRALLAIPGHALWTGTMGYFAARRRFDKWGPGIVGGYVIAVLGHGLYDYSVFVRNPLTFEGYDVASDLLAAAPFLLIGIMWLMMRRFARTALALDDADAARAMAPPPAAPPPAMPPPVINAPA